MYGLNMYDYTFNYMKINCPATTYGPATKIKDVCKVTTNSSQDMKL